MRCPGRLNDFLEGGQVRLDAARAQDAARRLKALADFGGFNLGSAVLVKNDHIYFGERPDIPKHHNCYRKYYTQSIHTYGHMWSQLFGM